MDGRLNPFFLDHSSHPEQAPPPWTIGPLDQRRKFGWGETRKDDLGARKVPSADLLGSSSRPGAHEAKDAQRSQVWQPSGQSCVLLNRWRLFWMLVAPSEPGIGPPTVAEPIIADDEDEWEAQARCRRDEPQRHVPHVPEGDDIRAIGCQHVLNLRLVVLFDGQRFLKGQVQAG